MPQKLVTITVGLGGPKVEEHLAEYLSDGWRVVMISAAAAGARSDTTAPQPPPRPGQMPGAGGRMAACVAVVLERAGG
jgi:hypothetical protein